MKPNPNDYFTKVVDDAIVKYKITTDKKEKEKLFKEIIEPSFRQLVEKVVYAYNFTGLKNVSDLKDDCFIALVASLEKFKPEYGSKAFSYFTVITKNWFILKFKEEMKQRQMMEQLGILKDIDVRDTPEEEFFKHEFFQALVLDLEEWNGPNKKMNMIVEAIKTMLVDVEKFDFCSKSTIFFSLKEITGLKTPELTYLMKKVLKKYGEFKLKWIEEHTDEE